jgi:hypothetical protein
MASACRQAGCARLANRVFADKSVRGHHAPPRNAPPPANIQLTMPISMRALLSADTSIPEALRAGIASGDPASAAHLMTFGLNECEAAELLDEPCSPPSGDSDSDVTFHLPPSCDCVGTM